MSAKLYVGNISWSVTEDVLRSVFENHGQVVDVIIMRDRDTGRSRGFGFITMGSNEEADTALAALQEQEVDGRRIRVNRANANK
ncbi:unnamed protein product [Cunninghamella blakesleeana]